MLAVDVKNIKKTFTSKQDTVEAVKDVSFQVEQGEIFGLLGPNGAGKSTTILMLTTLLSITDGKASILGIDVETQDKEVREKIGVALQDTGIDKILTGRELFFTTSRLWGYSKADSEKRTEELLELVGLTEAGDRRVKTYSGGMKRRLDLGLSLVHSPEILFLDEPTTGLDPGSRRVLWEEIKRLRDSGVTIILTTQYLEEADELADRIAIIDEGLVVAEGTSDELKASIGGDVITLSFYSDEDLEKAKNILTDAVQSKDELRITVADGASKIPEYINKLISNQRKKSIASKNSFYTPKGKKSAKDILDGIKKNSSMVLLVDQKDSAGEEVIFFNSATKTQTGFLKIARKYNMQIIPVQNTRNNLNNFSLKFYPPLKLSKNHLTEKQEMEEIHRIIEKWIINNPSNWFLQHNRFS